MKIFYEVVEKIMDSRDVTVGGGSASAVAGAMAAGLVGMVSRLSVGKEYGLPDERYLEIAEELDELAVQLKEGAVEDTRSYLGIKAAFALPKATDEQKSARRAAIESAAIKAANVPLENGRAAPFPPYGTGSYGPRLENGWHRMIRLKASQPPLSAPYFSIASIAYCEQVGI